MRLRLGRVFVVALFAASLVASSALAGPAEKITVPDPPPTTAPPTMAPTPTPTPTPTATPTPKPSASASATPTPTPSPTPTPAMESPTPTPTATPTPKPSPKLFHVSPTPSPSPTPTPTPTPKPTPIPVPHVLGISLSWPNGLYSIAVDAGSKLPHPIALVRVDAPGRILVQWRLDGGAFHTEFGKAKKAGDIRFELEQPLPHRGSHSVGLVILSPVISPEASPTPVPAIHYRVRSE